MNIEAIFIKIQNRKLKIPVKESKCTVRNSREVPRTIPSKFVHKIIRKKFHLRINFSPLDKVWTLLYFLATKGKTQKIVMMVKSIAKADATFQ